MRHFLAVVAILAGAPALAAPGVILDVASGAEIGRDALADRLAGADVAILGELHDNPVHHERQAWLVGRIAPDGIAFEMVPQGSEAGIAVFLDQGGKRGEIGPAIGWDRLGWPDWALYAPVFEAASARVTGGALPREALSRAMREGAAAAFGPDAARWGLDAPMPAAEVEAVAAEMVLSHCNMLPDPVARKMVEAQRLRDASFAAATLRARGAAGRAVLITGNGHARTDRGVPVYLAAAEPGLMVLALAQIELAEGEAMPPAADLPYDFVWFSAPHDRADPCAGFKGVPPRE